MLNKNSEHSSTPFAKKSQEIQNNLAYLDITEAEMKTTYQLNDAQYRTIMFGKPDDAIKGKFFNIYYDLQNKANEQRKQDNKQTLAKLLNQGNIFEKKTFYKLLRSVLQISQSELANLLNLSVSTVQKWEQGVSKATGGESILLYMLIPEEIKNQVHLEKNIFQHVVSEEIDESYTASLKKSDQSYLTADRLKEIADIVKELR